MNLSTVLDKDNEEWTREMKKLEEYSPPTVKTRMHPHEDYGREVIEMMQSFNAAIQKAGGSIWTAKALDETSVKDMMLALASNNIRFHYQEPK